VIKFIKGLSLCEQFFFEIAKPILDKHYPDLIYSVGLIGYGSDVLGYDDEISTDHMWGPRLYLFLTEEDIGKKQNIINTFSKQFPYAYKGYSVNFSEPDPNDNGVRHAKMIASGEVSPLIFIHTIDGFINSYLGISEVSNNTYLDWLSFCEHRLLALTSGKIFLDGLNVESKLAAYKFYPYEVKMYLLVSNWALIAEEQAFVKRCADCGDEIGSILVCSRIVERLMRLLFLYYNRYAPYSKWFGTAFKKLPVGNNIKDSLLSALSAKSIKEREDNLIQGQKLVGDLHNALKLTDHVEVTIQLYFGRNIKVIFADNIVDAILEKPRGTVFEKLPLIGTLSQVANFTSLFDNPTYRKSIKNIYS